MPSVLMAVAICGLLLGAGALVHAWRAFRRRSRLRGSVSMLCGLLLLALAALAGAITVATRGYRALSTEKLAATLRIEPLPDKHFHATLVLPGQPVAMYDLAGNVFYIDAHILRWHSLLRPLGLHTAYRLASVAGRDKNAAYSLAQPAALDMFRLVKTFPFLTLLVDAEHKSATVTAAGRAANFDVLVSTTGLVIRPAAP